MQEQFTAWSVLVDAGLIGALLAVVVEQVVHGDLGDVPGGIPQRTTRSAQQPRAGALLGHGQLGDRKLAVDQTQHRAHLQHGAQRSHGRRDPPASAQRVEPGHPQQQLAGRAAGPRRLGRLCQIGPCAGGLPRLHDAAALGHGDRARIDDLHRDPDGSRGDPGRGGGAGELGRAVHRDDALVALRLQLTVLAQQLTRRRPRGHRAAPGRQSLLDHREPVVAVLVEIGVIDRHGHGRDGQPGTAGACHGALVLVGQHRRRVRRAAVACGVGPGHFSESSWAFRAHSAKLW